jgi:hypothetical protein
MAHAKARGGGRCEHFEPTLRGELVQRLNVERDLRLALERDELRVVYQPIVRLTGGEVRGFEALVRWDHPERGELLPGEFGQAFPLGRPLAGDAVPAAQLEGAGERLLAAAVEGVYRGPPGWFRSGARRVALTSWHDALLISCRGGVAQPALEASPTLARTALDGGAGPLECNLFVEQFAARAARLQGVVDAERSPAPACSPRCSTRHCPLSHCESTSKPRPPSSMSVPSSPYSVSSPSPPTNRSLPASP